jgi:hypothetical protein
VSPIEQWAARHGVTRAALEDLATNVLSSMDVETVASGDPGSEARVQSLVRLEAPHAGYWLTRNNVGAYQDPRGIVCVHCHRPALGRGGPSRWVRYGLANESKQQNQLVKSADLIGWRRRVIISADVGTVIAQFASREVKKEGWSFDPNDSHEQAQAAWRDFVNSNGGDAAFVSGPGSFQHPARIIPLPPLKR